MRGIATVIVVGFVSLLLFGVIAPGILEPVAQVVVQEMPAESGVLDATDFADRLLTSVLVWAPLVVLAAGVASAVVWYLRRERRSARRVR